MQHRCERVMLSVPGSKVCLTVVGVIKYFSYLLYSQYFGCTYCRCCEYCEVFRGSIMRIRLCYDSSIRGVRYCGYSLYFKHFRVLYCEYLQCTQDLHPLVLWVLRVPAVQTHSQLKQRAWRVWSIVRPWVHRLDMLTSIYYQKPFTDVEVGPSYSPRRRETGVLRVLGSISRVRIYFEYSQYFWLEYSGYSEHCTYLGCM